MMQRGAPEGGGLDRPLGVGGDEEATSIGRSDAGPDSPVEQTGASLERQSLVHGRRHQRPIGVHAHPAQGSPHPRRASLLEGRARRLVGAVQDPVRRVRQHPGLRLPDSSWCTNTLSSLSTLRWYDGSSSAFRSATAICGTKVITTNPVAWKVHQDEGARWIRSELIGMMFASIPRRRLGSQRPVTAPGFTAMIEECCQQGQRQTGGVQVFPACSSRVGFMTATAWSIMARMSAASSSGSRSAIQMRRLRPSPSARTWTDAL